MATAPAAVQMNGVPNEVRVPESPSDGSNGTVRRPRGGWPALVWIELPHWNAPATMRPDMLALHVISRTFRPAGATGSLCAGARLTVCGPRRRRPPVERGRVVKVVDHQLEGSSSWRGCRTSGDHFVSRGSQLAGRSTIQETGGSGHGGTHGHGMATTNLLLGTNRIDHHSRYRSVTTKRGER